MARRGVIGDVLLGAASGLLAGWVMTRAQGPIGRLGSEAVRRREAEASRRAGAPATVLLAERVARLAGRRLDAGQKRRAGTAIHYATSALWGGVFGAVPPRLRRSLLLAGFGLGSSLWLVEDELLVPLLGLARGPGAYPPSSHAKALASHLVYGASTAGTFRILSAARA